ncbi:hypothetical protein MKX03_009126 [Papaver bracteatum]|nr:hypothetical protein MKX03_009126 [Papaver bracteatum]
MRSLQGAWLFLAFCIVFNFNSDKICVRGKCLNDQRALLVKLNQSIFFYEDDTFSTSLSSWSLNTDCCSFWSGIECGKDAMWGIGDYDILFNLRYLERLNLAGNNLYEPIPSGIHKLSNLKYLNLSASGYDVLSLSHCHLSGPLDSSLSKFQSLRKLHLDGNSISSEVPEFLGEFQNLTSLHLSDCDLYGKCPEKILQLPRLESLDLSSNRGLEGFLPNSIGNLRLLSILNLRDCKFNGTIPTSISKLNHLQYLDLSFNSFTGDLDENFIGYSSPLEFLDLSYNQLQGRLPLKIFEFSRLYHLGLVSNSFTGTISLDKVLNKLGNLKELYLSGNRFSISTRANNFALYPQLDELSLSSCNLTEFPIFLKNQSKLRVLELSQNQIHGEIPNWICKIGNDSGYNRLQVLNISYNFLEDPNQPLPDDIFHNGIADFNLILPKLTSVFDYSLNKLTTISDSFSQLGDDVKFFSLSGNQITGDIPTWICQLPFQVLDLSNNNFIGPIPSCLGSIFSDKLIINLRGNNLQGIIPDFPADYCTLEMLDLNGNKFQGKLPKFLANCTNLGVLDVGNNQLHGSLPSWLGSMSSLRVLVLRSKRFNGPWGNQLGTKCNLPLLQIIDVSSNNFSGSLPNECFYSWESMMANQVDQTERKHRDPILGDDDRGYDYYYRQTVKITIKGQDVQLEKIRIVYKSVDFSDNEFDGEIPEIIGNFTLLYNLDLSGNTLTGSILSAFGNLTSLESLDLSRNKLTGEIPLQLTRLSFLSYLNLSFNRLEGKIPSGDQFVTFEPSSFEGNVGLCGSPLSRYCNITNAHSPTNTLNSQGGAISVDEFDWDLFVVSFLGFIVGASMVIGPQYFWKNGREWFNERINRILNIT